jgi:hypothetical protein
MSVASVAEALSVYERLPRHLRSASFHPCYVLADARRSSSLQPTFFVHEQDGEQFYHAFHTERVAAEAAQSDRPLIDIQSPYGYGGPLATTTDERFLASAWRAFDAWCEEQGVLVEFLRFHPRLENWRYFGGEVMHTQDTVWIDVQCADLMDSYTTRARTAIRKAIAQHVTFTWVRPPAFLAAFPDLYAGTMRNVGAADSYYFPQAYFEDLAAWNMVWLGQCSVGCDVVCGAIFLVGADLVEYHLSASNETGRKLSATNLLIHRAAERARTQGKTTLHLGGGSTAAASNPLLFFKRGFSPLIASFKIGRKVHRPNMYETMKESWTTQRHTVPTKVLFYKYDH